MLSFGTAPFLECSSRGDKHFSAFYARIRRRSNKTIEELYQARKMFKDGTSFVSGLPIKEAKGRLCVNIEDCRSWYTQLWYEYIEENPDLLNIIFQYNGYTDIFGQIGHACQAEEIYKIRYGIKQY